MWYDFFAEILDRSVVASVVILAVFVSRAILCRFPKKYLYLLWVIVALRLVCPLGVSSPFSLFYLVGEEVQNFSVSETGLSNAGTREVPADSDNADSNPAVPADAGESVAGSDIINETHQLRGNNRQSNVSDRSDEKKNSESMKSFSETKSEKKEPEDAFLHDAGNQNAENPLLRHGTIVWLIGIAVILFRNLFMTFRMTRHLEKAVRYRGNIYESDNIPSPFVMGILRPKIYIPFRLGEEEREYILKHEQYHIKRRDYLIKLFAFLLTCVYWFHPLVWASYILMLRDMEMSCDEYVLQHVEKDIRKSYSQSLLGFAMNQRGMAMGLLAFGETGARRRVRNVLNFKKYRKWMGIVTLLLVLLVGLVCLTDANAENSRKSSENAQQSGRKVQEQETRKEENPATNAVFKNSQTTVKKQRLENDYIRVWENEDDDLWICENLDGTNRKKISIKNLWKVLWLTNDWVYYATFGNSVYRVPVTYNETKVSFDTKQKELLLRENDIVGENFMVTDSYVLCDYEIDHTADDPAKKDKTINYYRYYFETKNVTKFEMPRDTMIIYEEETNLPVLSQDTFFMDDLKSIYRVSIDTLEREKIYSDAGLSYAVEHEEDLYFIPSDHDRILKYDGDEKKVSSVLEDKALQENLDAMNLWNDEAAKKRGRIEGIYTYQNRLYIPVILKWIQEERAEDGISKGKMIEREYDRTVLLSADFSDMGKWREETKLSDYLMQHASYEKDWSISNGTPGITYYCQEEAVIGKMDEGKLLVTCYYATDNPSVAVYDVATGEIQEIDDTDAPPEKKE